MKRIIVILVAIAFAGALTAQNTPKAVGKNTPAVAQDNGKEKDNGKHVGEDREHRHHHRHHHEHRAEGKK